MKYSSHTANLLLDSAKNIIGASNIQNEIYSYIMSNLDNTFESVTVRGNSIYYTAGDNITADSINNSCLYICTELFNKYADDICGSNNLTRYDLNEIVDQHNLIDRMYMIIQCNKTYEIIV